METQPLATQTFTFLFTDIEGSTAMLQRLGDAYADVLTDHHRLLRLVLAAHDGKEVDTQGDAFFAVFSSASACAAAAIEVQLAFMSHAWPAGETVRVRMGIHSGEASESAVGLVGLDIHRAARIAAVAHGGQVVLSASTAALLRDRLPDGAFLQDLGSHRLKDLGRPEQIFQLEADGLPAEFPPLRSLDNPRLLNNLPAQVSRFIGRDAVLAEVRHLIGAFRLITLTGPGGVGKTRTGLQVAAELLDGSGDGVWFADLAPLLDPDLVVTTVANVLGIRGDPARPVDTLVEAIGGRSMLLLLDNCEHVIGTCAKLADALLRNCPNVTILATSREPLGIDGERVHRIPSLGMPTDDDDSDTVRETEAVRLLIDRAAQHGVTLGWDERSATLAGRICRRLDGIPLAIELAAARLRAISVTELEARLDQRFSILTGGSRAALPRQQTLLAMVDWSWELLHASERHVLARLSVFAGGFDLAAAEAVTLGEGVRPEEVIGLLGALVDKNLVQFGDTGTESARYRLLETVRQYATRHLEAGSPAAAHDARVAHRDHYLTLAQAAAPRLVAPDQAEWLDRLDLELGNLRAAIAFCLEREDPAPGITLVSCLEVFWRARGRAAEGADALARLLGLPTAQGATLPRARGLATAAYLSNHAGLYAAAEQFSEEGLAVAQPAGDDYLVARLMHTRAYVLLRQGHQAAAALPLIERGLGLARRLEAVHLTARLLADRSYALDVQGDFAAAARDAAEALSLYRLAGDRRESGTILGNLGYTELSTGDLGPARSHLIESLDIARVLNDSYGVVYGTFNLGLAEYLGGSVSAAEDLFTESFSLARRVMMRAGIAYALIGLAMAGSDGDPGRAARLHGAAEAALAALGETVDPVEARLRERDCQRLRSVLGPEAFAAEYAAGQSLSSEEILVLALGQRA
jgi:predicted ATPase/class 3 adenylate cyclase